MRNLNLEIVEDGDTRACLHSFESRLDAALIFDYDLDLAFELLKNIVRYHAKVYEGRRPEYLDALPRFIMAEPDHDWQSKQKNESWPARQHTYENMVGTAFWAFCGVHRDNFEATRAFVDLIKQREEKDWLIPEWFCTGKEISRCRIFLDVESHSLHFPGIYDHTWQKEFPFTLVEEKNYADFLQHLIDNKSPFLPYAFKNVAQSIANMFSEVEPLLVVSQGTKKVINLTDRWVENHLPAGKKSVPGRVRQIVADYARTRKKHSGLARQALTELDEIREEQQADVARLRQQINHKVKGLRTIWSP